MMIRQNRRGRWFRQLTPKMAWEQYTSSSVEMFISNFMVEGYTEIDKMCQKFAEDIPSIFPQLFSQHQLDHIGRLLAQYIKEYIDNKGGLDKLELYSEEELDIIWEEEMAGLSNILHNYGKKK